MMTHHVEHFTDVLYRFSVFLFAIVSANVGCQAMTLHCLSCIIRRPMLVLYIRVTNYAVNPAYIPCSLPLQITDILHI